MTRERISKGDRVLTAKGARGTVRASATRELEPVTVDLDDGGVETWHAGNLTRDNEWWCPKCEKPRRNSVCDGKFDHADATHQEAVRCVAPPDSENTDG